MINEETIIKALNANEQRFLSKKPEENATVITRLLNDIRNDLLKHAQACAHAGVRPLVSLLMMTLYLTTLNGSRMLHLTQNIINAVRLESEAIKTNEERKDLN